MSMDAANSELWVVLLCSASEIAAVGGGGGGGRKRCAHQPSVLFLQ
jgi:hypothetical protein